MRATAARVRSSPTGTAGTWDILGYDNIICRDMENEAKDFFAHVLDRGDWEVVRMVSGGFGAGAGRSARSSSCPGRLLAARAA
ncbi:hypothetical protein ACQP25_23185 [Microtetraspora malaysiensis]|uniref:hypothetical protein n=1 Tax=Microtetraspora malaysiensis TaxID=161358 RepID=UPI003D8A71C0